MKSTMKTKTRTLRACTTNKCNDNEDDDDDDDENRCVASLGYLEEEYEAGGEKDSSLLLQLLKTSGFGNVSPIAPRNNMNKNNNDTTMHTWSSESNDEFGFHSLAVPAALRRKIQQTIFCICLGTTKRRTKTYSMLSKMNEA